LFKTILADQKFFPKDQPYKDLVALVNYVLRQFFKAVEADSFVLIEVRPALPCVITIPTRSGVPSEFSMCTGILPKESESMEEVLQLGTREQSETDKGS